jgi:hypothetical protein
MTESGFSAPTNRFIVRHGVQFAAVAIYIGSMATWVLSVVMFGYIPWEHLSSHVQKNRPFDLKYPSSGQ